MNFERYDANGYPEVDHTQFVERIPRFDSEDQGIIIECEIEKDVFESVNFNISGTTQGNSLILKCLTTVTVPLAQEIEDVARIYPRPRMHCARFPWKSASMSSWKACFPERFQASSSTMGKKLIGPRGVQALFEKLLAWICRRKKQFLINFLIWPKNTNRLNAYSPKGAITFSRSVLSTM